MSSFLQTSLLLLCCALVTRSSDYPPPREPYTLSWTGAPMVWPNEASRSLYRTAGNLDPSHMVGTRFALLRDQVFVAFPRFLDGVCATLARSSLLSTTGEPSWDPFPSWEAQTEGDPRALQNVVDLVMETGPKEVLWVLDIGVTETLSSPHLQCGPKVVGFDPTTGKRLHTVELSDFVTPNSRLQFLVVDVDPTGQTIIIVSDAGENSIIVYNLDKDIGYRAALPDVVSHGCEGGARDTLYLASTKSKPGENDLYMTYACGGGIYSLHMADLRAGTTEGTLEVVAERKPTKMEFIGTEPSRGVIYFKNDEDPNVYSWNVDTDLSTENIREIHHGESSLQATHAVYDPLRGKPRVILSNFQDFVEGSVGVGAVQVLRAAE